MTTEKNVTDDDAKKLIQAAVDIIGQEDSEDYRIVPTRFVDLFQESAPQFSEVLTNATLTETARRYEQKDAQAGSDQKVFKKLSSRATWAVFVATVTAAVLTGYASNPTGEPIAKYDPVALILGGMALVAGAYAAMLVYQINGGGFLSRWMSARAAAETERLGYFNRLVRLVTTSCQNQPDILLFSLELFRRYQLALQQTYYNQRGRQHRQSMDTTLKLGSVAAGILALCSGGAGILGYFEPQLLPFAVVGILGSALATVASRREEMNQDERNAERYGRTADVLSHLREKHTDVQRAVAAGNTEVLIDYVNAVHEQLSLEHRQWLAQTEAIESAVEKLSQSLKEQAPPTGETESH
jgi:hypothetical protein